MNEVDSITIVIPTHNRSELFHESIISLINQTNPNWKAVVVDDNSSIIERSRIKNICAKDDRITFLQNKRERGASGSRNTGLYHAPTNHVLFMDSDDVLAPHCIENRIEAILNDPSLDFWVFGGVKVFHRKPEDSNLQWNVFTTENDLERFIKVDPPWHTSSPIWNKATLILIGGFNESALVWNDWELHIRAIAKGLKYKKINNSTDAYYRKHDFEAISKNDKTLEHTLNRFETLKALIALVRKEKLLSNKIKKSFSQQLLFIQLEYDAHAQQTKNLFQLVAKERLLSSFQYLFWVKYLEVYRSKPSSNNKIIMDKFAYTILRYHFLEVDNTFLKMEMKQAKNK